MDDHVARRKRIFGLGMLVSVQWYTWWDCGQAVIH